MNEEQTPVVPDFIITEEEIAEVVKPFAVDYGGRAIVLRSGSSLSIDDVLAVDKIAEDSIVDALDFVAVDEFTKTTVRAMPHPLLVKVFEAWSATVELAAGEADGSEESSETTEPQ